MIRSPSLAAGLLLAHCVSLASAQAPPSREEMPANTWVRLCRDEVGARRGCAVRFAPQAGTFFLWGFADADPEFLQERPAMSVPEHDVVAFDHGARRWRGHLPRRWEAEWGKRLPPTFVPRTYHGLTSGSERSLFRPPPGYPAEAARPDPNIVFDQVAYHPPTRSLIYFTGGLTAAYHVEERRWSDLTPAHSPPPVLGGALAHDPVHDELVLFGGGHVAEAGPAGRTVGYTGTWVYSFKDRAWRSLELDVQPPPRMLSRLVCDPGRQLLILFGGDGQSHYLADAWLFDLKTRRWRPSRAPGGPPARAGHFTVFDPKTRRVIVGGGHNDRDLTDMWAYDPDRDRWQRLAGEVPTGAYVSADIDPGRRQLLLVSNTRAPGHRGSCDVLYAARTTYAYRIDETTLTLPDRPEPQKALPKRPGTASGRDVRPDLERSKAQAERLRTLPINQWVLLAGPARAAPARTWGSATFDTDRGRILYWGGGHCGYGGSDVDAYDVASHTWVSSQDFPPYPQRLWARGVRLAGVTFDGSPWTVHGRRIYAYDPTCGKMLAVRPIQLTTGYEPGALRAFPGQPRARVDTRVKPPTSYSKDVTWAFDPDAGRWEVVGPAPEGLDTLVSTRHGVMGVNVDWPTRLNDAGYLLPWDPDKPARDNAVFLFDAARKRWRRLGKEQASPQNLYEMTSLAFDEKRDRLLLHGGGQGRDELWGFDLEDGRWKDLRPRVLAPRGAPPPACNREAVHLPRQDVLLTFGPAPRGEGGPALWAHHGGENAWYRVAIAPPPGSDPRQAAGQNRALVYDPARDLVLLVIGSGNGGDALVYALRYRHDRAGFVR